MDGGGKEEAVAALNIFIEIHGAKCERAVKKLTKDIDV